jgi:hypothetical protein
MNQQPVPTYTCRCRDTSLRRLYGPTNQDDVGAKFMTAQVYIRRLLAVASAISLSQNHPSSHLSNELLVIQTFYRRLSIRNGIRHRRRQGVSEPL